MKFVLYGINFSPELTGIGKYTGELASWLVEQGHEVEVVTAPPYYPEWEVHSGYSSVRYSSSDDVCKVFRCPIYVPKTPTTLKRLVHLVSFAVTSAPVVMSRLLGKADVLIVVQPTLFCAPVSLFFSKMFGVKSILHVQDYELDAMFGLGMLKRGFWGKAARSVESFLMNRFDLVSTISLSMVENAIAKGVAQERTLLFPNWADTSFVTPDSSGEVFRKKWGISCDEKVVLYSGNIGKKQGLEIVLDAAEKIQNATFLFVGAGAHVKSLKLDAQQRGLTNVIFKPLQDWALVPNLLALADVHLVVQKRGAADAVLPSKLTNILSVGGEAIVTAEIDTELGKVHKRFPGIYELVEPENAEAFISVLSRVLDTPRSHHNVVARRYALEYLSREHVLARFEEDVKRQCC